MAEDETSHCNLGNQRAITLLCLKTSCVNNHYAKIEYKEMKSVAVINFTNQAPSKHSGRENVEVQHPPKMRKYS